MTIMAHETLTSESVFVNAFSSFSMTSLTFPCVALNTLYIARTISSAAGAAAETSLGGPTGGALGGSAISCSPISWRGSEGAGLFVRSECAPCIEVPGGEFKDGGGGGCIRAVPLAACTLASLGTLMSEFVRSGAAAAADYASLSRVN